MSEKKDIKEISELIDGIEAAGVPVAKALADGKINALDLPYAMDLVKGHQKIIDAVQGISGVIPEGKDIDPAEAVIIVQKLMSVAKKIKEASKVAA
ncbi:MAG: hypothetical protein H0X02_11370 [Nitrosomonas sp.]|nr:hypothetical protein [Nitrosomonas sp.]